MTTEERAAVEAWMRENDIPWPTTYTKEGQA